MTPWRKRWGVDTEPVITPDEYERQKSEALDKLVAARETQQAVAQTTGPLRERNPQNHYALGILQAMGVRTQ